MFARIRISLAAAVVVALGALTACGSASVKDDASPCCGGAEGTTTCPVSGEKFTATDASPKAEYEGKTYTFCCAGCAAKFKADPAKYAAGAAADAPCEGDASKDCGSCCPKCKEGCKDCPKCKDGGCASCEDCKKGSCPGCGT